MEILGADEVLVGHDTLDGCDDVFVAQTGLEFLQMTLEVGRRSDENQRVVLLGNLVEVAGEGDFVDVEPHALQVGGVVAQSQKILDAVVAADIPSNVVGVSHHNLGYSRGPRASANDGYASAVKHKPHPRPLSKGRGESLLWFNTSAFILITTSFKSFDISSFFIRMT